MSQWLMTLLLTWLLGTFGVRPPEVISQWLMTSLLTWPLAWLKSALWLVILAMKSQWLVTYLLNWLLGHFGVRSQISNLQHSACFCEMQMFLLFPFSFLPCFWQCSHNHIMKCAQLQVHMLRLATKGFGLQTRPLHGTKIALNGPIFRFSMCT